MVMRCRWSAWGLTAPGYHHGARERDSCVIRNPHKVSQAHLQSVAINPNQGSGVGVFRTNPSLSTGMYAADFAVRPEIWPRPQPDHTASAVCRSLIGARIIYAAVF